MEEGDLPEPRSGDAGDRVLAGRMQLETLDAAVAVVAQGCRHPLHDCGASVADQFGEDPLMDDVRVETRLDGLEIASAPGVEMVEDRLHGCVAHRRLLGWAVPLRSSSIEHGLRSASEQKGPTVQHGVR